MRKIVRVIAVLIVCTLLVGCRNPRIQDRSFYGGERAIEILEAYKEFKISNEEARHQIDAIRREIDNFKEPADMRVASALLLASTMVHANDDIDEAIDHIKDAIYE